MSNRKTLSLLAALMVGGSGCYENFRDGEKVTNYSGGHWLDSSIAADNDGNLHVLGRSTASLRHYRSEDSGATWDAMGSVDDSDSAPFHISPEVVTKFDPSTGNLYVAYTEAYASGGAIVFRRSEDNGATWSAPETLRAGENPKSHLYLESRESVSDPEVVVVWKEFDDGEWRMLARGSEDEGNTWASSVKVAWGRGVTPLGLRYASNSGRVVALYGIHNSGDRYRTEIRSKYSSSVGASWSPWVQVNESDYGKMYDLQGGDLERNGDDLVAVWATQYHLSVAVSSDGLSWGSHESLATGWNNRKNLDLNFQDGLPAVLSYEANEDYYYRENDGTTWASSRRLNNFIDGVDQVGGLVADAGQLNALWIDSRWDDGAELTWAMAAATPTTGEFSCSFSQGTTFPYTSRLEVISFEVNAGNWTDSDDVQDVWVLARGENGLEKVIYARTDVPLASETEQSVTVSLTVPPRAPRQSYELIASIGDYALESSIDQDQWQVIVE